MTTMYMITHNKRDANSACCVILESKTEMFPSRAAQHAAASGYIAEYMKDWGMSGRTLIIFGESSSPIQFLTSPPNYDVIATHFARFGKFWCSISPEFTHEFVLETVKLVADDDDDAETVALPPAPDPASVAAEFSGAPVQRMHAGQRAPAGAGAGADTHVPTLNCKTYAHVEDRNWVEVPTIRGFPALDVSPRAIREFRVSLFAPKTGVQMLVVDTKSYNGVRVRQVFDAVEVVEVKTLHGRKVAILVRSIRLDTTRVFNFGFTDDACAFAFQMEIEMALR